MWYYNYRKREAKASSRKGYKQMYEYTIKNINTNEEDIIFGYNESDARRRANLIDNDEWVVTDWEYVD